MSLSRSSLLSTNWRSLAINIFAKVLIKYFFGLRRKAVFFIWLSSFFCTENEKSNLVEHFEMLGVPT